MGNAESGEAEPYNLDPGNYVIQYDGVEIPVTLKTNVDEYHKGDERELTVGDGCVKLSFTMDLIASELDSLMFTMTKEARKTCPKWKPKGYGGWLLRLVDQINLHVLNVRYCDLQDDSSIVRDYVLIDKDMARFLMFRRGYSFYEGHFYIPNVNENATVEEAVEEWNELLLHRHKILTDPDELKGFVSALKRMVRRCKIKVQKRARRAAKSGKEAPGISAKCEAKLKAAKYMNALVKLGTYSNIQELAVGLWERFLETPHNVQFRQVTQALYSFLIKRVPIPLTGRKYYKTRFDEPVTFRRTISPSGLVQIEVQIEHREDRAEVEREEEEREGELEDEEGNLKALAFMEDDEPSAALSNRSFSFSNR